MARRDPRKETLMTRKRRLTSRHDLTATLRIDLIGIVRQAIPNYELTPYRGEVELWIEVIVAAFGDSLKDKVIGSRIMAKGEATEFLTDPRRHAEVFDTLGINREWLLRRTRTLRARRDALLKCPHKAPCCLNYVETKRKVDTSRYPKGLRTEW